MSATQFLSSGPTPAQSALQVLEVFSNASRITFDRILAGLPDIKFKDLKFNTNYALPNYFEKVAKEFEGNGIISKCKIYVPKLKLDGKAFMKISREGLEAEFALKKWRWVEKRSFSV